MQVARGQFGYMVVKGYRGVDPESQEGFVFNDRRR